MQSALNHDLTKRTVESLQNMAGVMSDKVNKKYLQNVLPTKRQMNETLNVDLAQYPKGLW